jgi:heterodisulfide reductase subunit B
VDSIKSWDKKMVTVSYYPGCSLQSSAREFDESIRAMCQVMGIQLQEIADWNCCGATAAHSLSHDIGMALPARNLFLAERAGYDVVVPCASCFHQLKSAEKVLLSDKSPEFSTSYQGKIKIWDCLDFMSREEMLVKIEEKIKKPLKNLRVVCYYGCLVARPPRTTDTANYENPENMDRLVKVLGASPYPWSYKTDCCGASMTLVRPDIVKTLAQRLYEKALEAEAECFVVACQMCQANLDIRQREISKELKKTYYLPVFYFTELMGLAMEHPDVHKWLKRHLVDPTPLLKRKGLI